MFNVPIRTHTLSKRRDDRGVFCGLDGFFVGPVPLLDSEIIAPGKRYFARRSLAVLNRELERCYGLPVDAAGIIGGIGAVARLSTRAIRPAPASPRCSCACLRFPTARRRRS
jgi:hypothetical protein